jgi:branched-chain amino acid transport system substrate-binding protein
VQRLWKASAVTLAAAGTIALAACASSSGRTSGSGSGGKSPYTIGYVNDLSGPISVYGQYSYSYLQAIVKAANASGGVNGHPLNVVAVDSAAAGATGVSAVKQLISQNHPIAIYGNTSVTTAGLKRQW